METLSQKRSYIASGFSSENFYRSMNQALKRLNNEYTMLHFPYYKKKEDSFLQAQINLTDYCLEQLPSLRGKNVLEIGCGNGTQAIYISRKCSTGFFTGIDLDQNNIAIANQEMKRLEIKNMKFLVDDAQKLYTIESESVDCVLNIESALHYPDKTSFIREVFRVLKPGGIFLIADVLRTRPKLSLYKKWWYKKMNWHHWPANRYEDELQKANLEIKNISDITKEVIRGFLLYKNWIRTIDKKTFLNDLSNKIFLWINSKVNIYLFKHRRQYSVFVGEKTME